MSISGSVEVWILPTSSREYQKVRADYEYHKAEKPTRDYPGCPAQVEVTGVFRGDYELDFSEWGHAEEEISEKCAEDAQFLLECGGAWIIKHGRDKGRFVIYE